VASGDRFIFFKVGRNRRDDNFFFYRALHNYCFLLCMWSQVIDLFSSKQAGIAGMTVSFSIARGITWPERRSLHDLCQLFPSMHDYCFLPCMWPQVIDLFSSNQTEIAEMTVSFSIAWGIAWPEGRSDPKKKSHQKIVLLLVFLVVGDSKLS